MTELLTPEISLIFGVGIFLLLTYAFARIGTPFIGSVILAAPVAAVLVMATAVILSYPRAFLFILAVLFLGYIAYKLGEWRSGS